MWGEAKIKTALENHFLDSLAEQLRKDGTCDIPKVGHGVLNLSTNQLVIDLSTELLQKIRRNQ